MDKIFSARIDETVTNQISSLARRLRTSKKKIIESAIEIYAAQIDEEQDFDVFKHTCGAWQRKGRPGETVVRVRKAFQDSMERHR